MFVYWKLLLFSLFQCLIGFNGLYHLASLNVIEPFVHQLINDSLTNKHAYFPSSSDINWIWSSITATFLVGYGIGSLLIEPLAEKFGRRITVGIIKNVALIIGSILQFLSKIICSWEILLVGRFVAATAAAFSEFGCVYVAECAPAGPRGFVSALTGLGYRIWTMVGITMGLPYILGRDHTWHFVLLVPVAPALLQILLTPLHPESPKHIFITQNKKDEARQAVRFYHGPEADVDAVLEEYTAEQSLQSDKLTLKSLWLTPHLKWPMLLVVVTMCSAALQGTDVVNQYSAQMLIDAGVPEGDSALWTLIIVQIPSFIVMIVGIAFLSCFGRRTLFLVGLAIAILGGIFMTLTAFKPFHVNALLVAGMAMVIVGDSVGPCLVRQFLPAELCPQISRSLSTSIGIFIDCSLSTLITFFWPPMIQSIGMLAMIILVIASIASFIFLYIYLPETKNTTVNQAISRWLEDRDEVTPILNNWKT